jgi:hypothetical protein
VNLSRATGDDSVAKLSFGNSATGAVPVHGTNTGVPVVGTNNKLNIVIDYIPTANPVTFTLIAGLEEFAALSATYSENHLTSPQQVGDFADGKWTLKIRESDFAMYFDSEGRLILTQTGYTNVPEPSTYALCGAALLAGLLLLRRRRKTR